MPDSAAFNGIVGFKPSSAGYRSVAGAAVVHARQFWAAGAHGRMLRGA